MTEQDDRHDSAPNPDVEPTADRSSEHPAVAGASAQTARRFDRTGRLGRRAFLSGTASVAGAVLGATVLAKGGVAEALAPSGQDSGGDQAAARTPDERFRGLPDFPFQAHYLFVAGASESAPPLRMHYLDERPSHAARASGETVLLLHGNPSWSYQYRNVIPQLVAAGHRCVAPDLVGFGRSDKPVDRFVHTYAGQVEWLREALVDRLDLSNITLVCHDWGGLLGLRLLAEHPERFRRVVASNTNLHTGDDDLGSGWQILADWLQYSQRSNPFDPGQVVDLGTVSGVPSEVEAAYRAPFPDERYVAAARQLPLLIPITPYDPASPANRHAWNVLETLQTPFLCVFSDHDPTTAGADQGFRARIPGAQRQPDITITDTGHFLMEEKPAEFTQAINDFIART